MENSSGVTEIRRAMDQISQRTDSLEREVARVTGLLADDTRYGRKGLLTEVDGLRKEQENLRYIVEGFERREEHRERESKGIADALAKEVRGRADDVLADATAREKKRDRFFVWVFGLLGTIIAGLIITGVGVYLNVLVGGGP